MVGVTATNFLTLKLSKTEPLVLRLSRQLNKLSSSTIRLPNNVTLSPVDLARNLGFILDGNLSYDPYITFVSKSYFLILYIRDLRRIRNMIHHTIGLLMKYDSSHYRPSNA